MTSVTDPAGSGSLAQVAAVVDLSPAPLIAVDADSSEIVLVNPPAAELLGGPAEVPDRQASGLWRHVRRDGEVRHLRIVPSTSSATSTVHVEGRALTILHLRDDTALVRAEQQRDRSVHRLLDLQEHLHNEIAERLHDGPVQILTAASLRIGMMRRAVDPSLEPKLAEIERLVIDALHALRREMDDQRAPLDIASDFAGSIRSVLTRFGLQDHYVVRARGPEPPASIASLLYRVVMDVLSTSPLGSDVDDPWVIDLLVGGSEASVQIPVAAGSDAADHLAEWTGAMGGVVEREVSDGCERLRMVIRIPPDDSPGARISDPETRR